MVNKKNAKISNIQFLLSILIVFIHSRTLFVNLPGSSTQNVYGINFSSFVQLFLGDGIARIAVPLYFIISGYLFFVTFDGSLAVYKAKLVRRLQTLLIPYLIWSFFVYAAFTVAQRWAILAPFFSTRNNGRFNIIDIWNNVIVNSYNSPLWFMRYLMVFSLLSIVIYHVANRFPSFLLGITFFLWLFNIKIISFVRNDAVFFYFLGAIIGMYKDKAKIWYEENVLGKKKIFVLLIIWIMVLSTRTVHFFQQDPTMMLEGTYDTFTIITEKIGIIVGGITFWAGYDYILGKDDEQTTWGVTAYSFLIFVCHHPVVNVLKKVIIKCMKLTEWTSLLTFFLSAFLTIILIIGVGSIIRKYFNVLFKIVTGGRS